jgi:hypothetical protein
MRALLDFDDAGATDDEPVKGVTVGDIHAWHDRVEELEAALRFYACDKHWKHNGSCDPNSAGFEGPNIARAALRETENDL